MGIFVLSQNQMDNVASLGCDTAADVADLPAFAESNRLKPGSTCLVVATSEVYMMKSDKTWKTI